MSITSANGFLAPTISPKLRTLLNDSSKVFYKKEMVDMGVGVSIPLMNILKEL
jgi:hypothetical protein